MKKRSIYILLWICLSFAGYSQEMRISVDGLNLRKPASLSLIQGEKTVFVDSIYANTNGDYIFTFNNNYHQRGLYALQFEPRKYLNIFYDNEPIIAKINLEMLPIGINIIESESNKYYQRFIKLNREYKTKTDILNYVLTKYPDKGEFYETTLFETYKVQDEYQQFIGEVKNKLPKSMVYRYIRSSQHTIVEYTLPIDQQLAYLKSHLLDRIDFQDYSLTNSDVFANKAIEYLMLYSNPQLPKEILEKEFIIAVDSILVRSRRNEVVYKHLVEYLIDGFRKFGFDLILDYLVTNYVIADDLCLDAQLETSLERRINQSKYLAIGKQAPDFTLSDKTGNEVKLSNIKTEKTVLVFYSTTCPHCREILPKLNALYNGLKKTEIIAISMDHNREEWEKFIEENKYSWKDVHESKGWSGKSAEDYYIYATPSMFVLDKKKRIVAKPLHIEEIKGLIE